MKLGTFKISANQMSKITDSLNEQLNWLTYLDTCSQGMTPDLRKALDALVKLNWDVRCSLNKAVKV